MQPDRKFLNMTTREQFVKGKKKRKKHPGLDAASKKFTKETLREAKNHPQKQGKQ